MMGQKYIYKADLRLFRVEGMVKYSKFGPYWGGRLN